MACKYLFVGITHHFTLLGTSYALQHQNKDLF